MNLSRESLCGALVVVTVDISSMLFSGLVEVKVEKQLEKCALLDVVSKFCYTVYSFDLTSTYTVIM